MKKTALITGASSGIGYEFAKVYARAGYNLVLVARNEANMIELKKKIEGKYKNIVSVYPCDLSRKDAAEEVYDFVTRTNISIDVLVNNAGFGDFGEFISLEWEKQYDMIQVNITALTQLTHLFMKDMVTLGRGKILNVASLGSFQPGPLLSTYYATKAYVLSFTEALSVELSGTGVSIMALCPGPTKTPFIENAHLKRSGLFKNMKNSSPNYIAEYGYRKLEENRVVVIPGGMNKMAAFGSKVFPRSLVRKMVYFIQK